MVSVGDLQPHQPIALKFVTFQWQGTLELPRGCCSEYGRGPQTAACADSIFVFHE